MLAIEKKIQQLPIRLLLSEMNLGVYHKMNQLHRDLIKDSKTFQSCQGPHASYPITEPGLLPENELVWPFY